MQSMFILSPTGEVLIERHFRENTPRSICDYFWERASLNLNHHGGLSTMSTLMAESTLDPMHDTVPPVMEVPSIVDSSGSGGGGIGVGGGGGGSTCSLYLFSILRDGLSYLAVCPSEVSPLLILTFLHRVADTFVDYFGPPADESAIKDNFSTVYQLLEEMVDYGWPLTTEPNALKALIRPPTLVGKLQQAVTGGSNAIVSEALPSGTISNMPWRAAGVKYNQNEIYIDIVEEVDAIMDMNGNLISSDVSGSIQAQSHLSGVPDLLLTFKDPNLIEDCSFHPCVRYGRFEMDKVVSFVPPDGGFELMRYRVVRNNVGGGVGGGAGAGVGVGGPTMQPFHSPIYVQPQWSYSMTQSGLQGRVVLNVGTRPLSSLIFSSSARKGPVHIEDVSLLIPFPRTVQNAHHLTVTVGSILYDEAAKIVKWTLGKLDHATSKRAQLQAMLELEGNIKPESNPNLTLQWKIPLASVSGLSVSGLSLAGESYRPYKGVRNITKSGRFQVRCS